MISLAFKKRWLADVAIVLGLLLVALALRWDAFWLPHWKGDQNHYVALAMKLDRGGLDAYSLREVRLGTQESVEQGEVVHISVAAPGQPGETGDILRILKLIHQDYYDEPFHMRAPLFPYTLMFSHRLFEPKDPYYRVVNSNLGEKVLSVKPEIIFKTQFWAAVVPVFFSLLSTLAVFILAKVFIGRDEAWIAAVLMATNPVGLTTSYRLLSEEPTLFCLLLSAGIFWQANQKNNKWGLFFAGFFSGLAVMGKQPAGIFLIAIWGYLLVQEGAERWSLAGVLRNIAHPKMILLAAGFLASTGVWFWKVYEIYGDPLHLPKAAMSAALKEDLTGWFRQLSLRPPPALFFSLGVIALCPFFAFVLWTLASFWRRSKNVWLSKAPNDFLVFLWLWVIGFYLYLSQPWHLLAQNYSQEHRYFYMAYPAIAMLAAIGALDFFRKIKFFKDRPWRIRIFIGILLILNAFWMIPQTMKLIYSNSLLL